MGRRDGTNPRALGTNPRARGTNPRATRGRFDHRDAAYVERTINRAHARGFSGSTLADAAVFLAEIDADERPDRQLDAEYRNDRRRRTEWRGG